MKNSVYALVLCALLLSAATPSFAQRRPAPPANIPDSINAIWKKVQQDFVSLAEAMPENKWNFKPTQGEFKDARTFAEQVKHVACANEAWARQIIGERPPLHCDVGGPNPAKSKTEIMAYLRDSFVLTDKAIAETGPDNLLHPNPGPYWGANRLSSLTAMVWHISDHYGQLVLYLRMNGVVPPASR